VALLNTVEEFDCIGAWSQPQEALTALQKRYPNVLLLDLRLQPLSNMELLQNLPSISPTTRVLVILNCPEAWRAALDVHPLPAQRATLARSQEQGEPGEDSLLHALQLGVWDIVYEEHGFHSIAQSIRKAYAGERFMDTATITRLAESYCRSMRPDEDTVEDQAQSLTLREWQVLRLIGQGCSNKDIAHEMQLSYSTIKNYVSSILKKLQMDGRTQIALYAREWSKTRSLPPF
jgi:DNA-binding NarL/FixJ family response regulator